MYEQTLRYFDRHPQCPTSPQRGVLAHPWGVRLVMSLAGSAVLLSSLPARAQEMKPRTEDQVKRAAVMVFTLTSKRQKNDTTVGSGSGFFINSNGLVITNNHVVDPTHLRSPEEKQQYHYQSRLSQLI